jgi:hypothetical protein
MWGLFVGGMALNSGMDFSNPTGPLRINSLAVTPGEGRSITQPMRVFRRFTTTVRMVPPGLPPYNLIPADTASPATGPLSIAVYDRQAAQGRLPFGVARPGCVDMKRAIIGLDGGAPVTATGFFYVTTFTDAWFGGQLDDFNTGSQAPPGAIISVMPNDAGQPVLPTTQVMPVGDEYAVMAPSVTLTGLVPVEGAPPASYACPVVP